MTTIPFTRQNPTTRTHTTGDYTIKERTQQGRTRYEVWKGSTLLKNDLGYFEVLRVYEVIVNDGDKRGLEWLK